jgi:SAM-dependent methyltransferase
VSEGGSGRPLSDRLFGWGRRTERSGTGGGAPADEGAASGRGTPLPTKAFGRFVAALAARDAPVLLDLGPIVGSNVNFLGERLGCKYFVEDLYSNIESHHRTKKPADLAEFFKTRFPQPDASFDGILCWDVLDHLDKTAAPIVAREMVRMLKPGGVLLGFFATVPVPAAEYTRYVIVDDHSLRHRVYPAARPRQQVFVNRDINRMFEGLTVSDSFLLLTKTREIVFRKPEQKAAPPG